MLSSDLQKLSVSGLITLYELDATKLGGSVMRWHGHVAHEDWQYLFKFASKTEFADSTYHVASTGKEPIVRRNIIFAGQEYSPVAIQTDGLEVRGDGRPSSPTLVIANEIDGNVGAVTLMCALYKDFAGATLKVTRLLAKYLDAENFTDGNPTANPNEFTSQYWTIEQKTEEQFDTVTFELASPLAAQRIKIPTINITSYCTWAVRGQYRSEYCGYTGTAMFTKEGKRTDDPAFDRCGGRLSDCKKRFGENNELGFGGYPASNLS